MRPLHAAPGDTPGRLFSNRDLVKGRQPFGSSSTTGYQAEVGSSSTTGYQAEVGSSSTTSYQAEVPSPGGGPLEGDKWSDPRDASKYSAEHLISLGFINSPEHAKLVTEPKPLTEVRVQHYDALLALGGQRPMDTFYQSEAVHTVLRDFYQAEEPVAVIRHATCALLATRLSDGSLLVEGKTSTGFANSEEDHVHDFVGQDPATFRIEDEATKLKSHELHRGLTLKVARGSRRLLITAQQQYSGAAAARLIIEALGV